MKRLFVLLIGMFFLSILPFKVLGQTPRIEYRWPDSLKGLQKNVFCLLVKDGTIFAGISTFFDTSHKYLFVSPDTGKTWVQRGPESGLGGSSIAYSLAVTPSGKLLLGGDNGLYFSTDNGVSWSLIPVFNNNAVECLFVSRSGAIFAGVGGDSAHTGLWKSSDDGNTWRQVASYTTFAFQIVSMTQTPSGTILAANVNYGSPELGIGVVRSSDDGETWVFSNNGLTGKYSKSITGIAAYPSGFSQEVFMVTYMDGAYYSNNDGLSWSRITEIPQEAFRGGAAAVFPPLGVFLGFSDPLYDPLYNRLGTSWHAIPGLKGYMVLSLAQFSPNQILVGTHDGMFLLTWENPFKVEDNRTPAAYSLSQNYPNPFNSWTKIDFALKNPGNVTLRVYDILGREVATLVNDCKPSGYHSVTFNAGNLPSGVYIYTLDAPEGIHLTKMMILVR